MPWRDARCTTGGSAGGERQHRPAIALARQRVPCLLAGCIVVAALLVTTFAVGFFATSIEVPTRPPPPIAVVLNDPEAAASCAPFHAVRSMVAAANPATGVVYCIRNASDDAFVSASLAKRGFWSDCLKAMHVLDMMAHARTPPPSPLSHIDRRRSTSAAATPAEQTTVVIDVGANIGACTALFAAHRQRWGVDDIVAFEPEGNNYALLVATVEANKETCRAIVLVHAAAWHKLTTGPSATARGAFSTSTAAGRRGRMYAERGNPGNAAMLASAPTGGESSAARGAVLWLQLVDDDARLTTVDEEMQRLQDSGRHAATVFVPLMKVDVQGSESSVLQGAESLLAAQHIGSVMLEVDVNISVATGHSVEAALTLLFQHRYRIFYWDKVVVHVVNQVVAGAFIANGFWERRVVRELTRNGIAPFVLMCTHAPRDVIAIADRLVPVLGGSAGVARRLRKFSDHGVLRALKQGDGNAVRQYALGTSLY